MFLSHQPRRALSLTEVLIAIFVMAIGMISLIVLFIVGLQNARAGLDTGRIAMMASSGNAVSEAPHVNVDATNIVRLDGSYSLRTDQKSNLASVNSYWANLPAMTSWLNRNTFLERAPLVWTFATNLSGIVGVPSGAALVYPPVMIDPLVANNPLWTNTLLGNLPFHVGTTAPTVNPYSPFDLYTLPQVPSSASLRPMYADPSVGGTFTASLGLPRSTLINYLSNSLGMNSDTTLPDEINFADNAQPFPYNPGPYQNDRRFSIAYLCRWPDLTKPEICDVTQVLYIGRPNGGGILTTPPGEVNYRSNVATSAQGFASVGIADTSGRFFIKGSTTAVAWQENGLPMAAKAGDWILDNTFILPEYDENNPNNKAPFLDTYLPNPVSVTYPPTPGGTTVMLRAGLAGGYFYKITGITDVQVETISGQNFKYQVLTLDHPARSDGFVGTMITGVADVIQKGVGRMPAR